MAVYVFRHLFKKEYLLSFATEKLKPKNFLEKQEMGSYAKSMKKKINALTDKLRRLIEMRANGEIDKDTYLTMKLKAEADKEQLQQELLLFDKNCSSGGREHISDAKNKAYLKQVVTAKNTTIDMETIEKFVTRIQVESETEFLWHIDLNSKTNKCTEILN